MENHTSTVAAPNPERLRAEIARLLATRRDEIEHAVLTRIYAVSDASEAADPEYSQGLRSAVRAAIGYGLAGIEHGEERVPAIPVALRAQARMAARNGVSLDTVLRRYVAGHAVIGDYVIAEVEGAGPGTISNLKDLLRSQTILFDRLLEAISQEYARESSDLLLSSDQRRVGRIQRLLAGEQIDTSGFAYDFNAHHLAVIACGPRALEGIRELAADMDRRLLTVESHDKTVVWAWLGGRWPTDFDDFRHRALSSLSPQVCLAVGEAAQGMAGWRMTHEQARAAFLVALRSSDTITRYADVALLASALQDTLLETSLRELYLVPLTNDRDGGALARTTLRAYFAANYNVSSAAAALKINRHTVTKRLKGVEERLGCPLNKRAPQLEIALSIQTLGKIRQGGVFFGQS